MPVTADYQFELNGLLMGPGTAYEIVGVEGLDRPPNRDTDLDKALTDGAFVGRNVHAKRTVTLTVDVVGSSAADLGTKIASFASAFQRTNTTSDLVYRLPGYGNRRLPGTARRYGFAIEQPHEFGVQRVVGEFVAPDPRIFDVASGAEVLY